MKRGSKLKHQSYSGDEDGQHTGDASGDKAASSLHQEEHGSSAESESHESPASSLSGLRKCKKHLMVRRCRSDNLPFFTSALPLNLGSSVTTPAENQALLPVQSLSDNTLQSSCKKFTPQEVFNPCSFAKVPKTEQTSSPWLSFPSLNPHSAENQALPRSQSLPDTKLHSSFEESAPENVFYSDLFPNVSETEEISTPTFCVLGFPSRSSQIAENLAFLISPKKENSSFEEFAPDDVFFSSLSPNVPETEQTSSPWLSFPSLSPHLAENQALPRSQSLADMKLHSSFEEFTPDVTADGDGETFRFQCSRPGVYLCTETRLVFDMEAGGTVVYRTVPWKRTLLDQHHKKPAGPLFDLSCEQQSVRGLHLPHCEICSTGAGRFLSVAHVTDEGVEFIVPHRITETHVVINVSGFSAYGNVKDEESPPDPVRALVLLFYRPPADPQPESQINVLLLAKNVSLRDVQRTRRSLVGEETYIETSPHCKLVPDRSYTLATCPQDDSVEVQPTEAEFFECYDNFFPSFQVELGKVLKHIKLTLRDPNRSLPVWERRVCLSSTGRRKSCGPNSLNLPPSERLRDVRSSFINGISGPILKSLLDKLLEKKVIIDPEREETEKQQSRGDEARFLIDTVRRKGDAASSEMIEILCELDRFLCEHLELI